MHRLSERYLIFSISLMTPTYITKASCFTSVWISIGVLTLRCFLSLKFIYEKKKQLLSDIRTVHEGLHVQVFSRIFSALCKFDTELNFNNINHLDIALSTSV